MLWRSWLCSNDVCFLLDCRFVSLLLLGLCRVLSVGALQLVCCRFESLAFPGGSLMVLGWNVVVLEPDGVCDPLLQSFSLGGFPNKSSSGDAHQQLSFNTFGLSII